MAETIGLPVTPSSPGQVDIRRPFWRNPLYPFAAVGLITVIDQLVKLLYDKVDSQRNHWIQVLNYVQRIPGLENITFSSLPEVESATSKAAKHIFGFKETTALFKGLNDRVDSLRRNFNTTDLPYLQKEFPSFSTDNLSRTFTELGFGFKELFRCGKDKEQITVEVKNNRDKLDECRADFNEKIAPLLVRSGQCAKLDEESAAKKVCERDKTGLAAKVLELQVKRQFIEAEKARLEQEKQLLELEVANLRKDNDMWKSAYTTVSGKQQRCWLTI